MIYKTLHRKLTIKHHKPYEDWGWAQMLCKGKKSLKIPRGLSEFLNRLKDRQYNRQKKPNSNDLQNTTQKTNDKAPWTPQKTGWAQMLCKGKKSLKIPKG